jgi:hypothetical protein
VDKIFKGMESEETTPSTGEDTADQTSDILPFEVSNGVIRLKKFGRFTFTPARPFFPALFTTSRDTLKTLNISETISAHDSKTGITDTGVINLKVLSVGGIKLPTTKVELKDSISFELVTQSGFDKINRDESFLMERISMTMGFEPVTLGRYEIVGDMGAAMTVKEGSATSSIMKSIGKAVSFEFSLELKEMVGLNK